LSGVAGLQNYYADSAVSSIGGASKWGDWWYDVAGWFILVGLGVGVAALVRNAPSPNVGPSTL
jgi:hypothetical protein